MINVNELTVGQVKELAALLGLGCNQPQPQLSRRLPMPIGTKVFIITVTRFYTGLVTAVSECEVELDQAAWIADTGRFKDALAVAGKLNEVEPYPGKIIVNREIIADWSVWSFDLPRDQK